LIYLLFTAYQLGALYFGFDAWFSILRSLREEGEQVDYFAVFCTAFILGLVWPFWSLLLRPEKD
jgi:hypothetical protein